jgi:inhibitor of cysteine peptidase
MEEPMVIRALLLVLAMLLGSCLGLSLPLGWPGNAGEGGEPPSPVSPGGETLAPVPVVVENVDVRILESYPPQVHLTVSGHHGTGCEGEVRVEQRREGHDVIVEIATWVPENRPCPKILRFYEGTIALNGPFEPGRYTLHVNDVAIDLSIP